MVRDEIDEDEPPEELLFPKLTNRQGEPVPARLANPLEECAHDVHDVADLVEDLPATPLAYACLTRQDPHKMAS